MVNPFIAILFGSAVMLLPLVSLAVWTMVLLWFFPYSRKEFPKFALLRGDASLRYIVISLIPVYFISSSLISAGISVVLEGGVVLMLLPFYGMGAGIPETLSVMSAGPIEESAKLLLSFLLYLNLYLVWRARAKRGSEKWKGNGVKDAMICGLFIGAAFGFLESILYMFGHFSDLASKGPSLEIIDPLVWRFLLGVAIHAIYTSIATAGLGRKTIQGKVAMTSAVLAISIIFHAVFNGVQGFIVFVLEWEGTLAFVVTDIIQMILVIITFVVFLFLWRKGDSIFASR
ncbi:MAG: PrsW family glutamic-type intramembrane protease [Thermoplasmatota archaeon]